MNTRRGRPAFPDQLTPAEWRVANAVRHGGTNREIAGRMGISAEAVKFHVGSILGKLGLADRRALRHWRGVARASALGSGGEGVMASVSDGFGAIGQISRSVKDIGAAEAWYRDVLGLPHLYTYGPLAFFDCGGTRLMLTAAENKGDDQFILYFRVPDIQAAHADFSARGIAFENAPHMIHRHPDGTEEWMAFFTDNEGRHLALMSQVKARG